MSDYVSNDVVMTEGKDAVAKAAKLAGLTEEEVQRDLDFAEEIIQFGHAKGLSTASIFTACTNVLIGVLRAQSPEARTMIVSGVTEALVACIGADTDTGRKLT